MGSTHFRGDAAASPGKESLVPPLGIAARPGPTTPVRPATGPSPAAVGMERATSGNGNGNGKGNGNGRIRIAR